VVLVVLDFMVAYLTVFVVSFILLKLQLVTLLITEQLYKLVQKTIMNLVTGPDKVTCSIFTLLMRQDVIQHKAFLQKANAGLVDVVADAMKHKDVFLGIHQDSQEWRQALARTLETMVLVAALVLSELSLLRVKHNAN
jgi:hypothetical protein